VTTAPPRCTVCRSPKRGEVDAALLEGGSKRTVADRFDFGESAIQRHRDHVPARLARVVQEAEDLIDLDNVRKVAQLETDARRLVAKLEAEADHRGALGGLRILLDIIERLAEVAEKAGSGAIDLETSPEWASLRTKILGALEPHPAARVAVIEALG
jgi:hypothetical protein